jgi:DNA-binding FrmR family transcriptional regulator
MSYRPKNTKERIAHRIKISLGHLKKVQQMISDDVYCIDVIHQSQAVQKALKEVDHLILEQHLKGCLTDAIQGGKKDEAIAELMTVLKRTN